MNAALEKLHALIIEDVDDDVLLLVNELRRGGYCPVVTRVDTPELLITAVEQQHFDIIFCDYSMPRMNGRQALSIVREMNTDVPFIFVSGTIGEDTAVDAMRTGAQDYIMKDNLKRLTPAVRRELADAKVRKEQHLAETRLNFLTNYDSLTQLPNRILFLKLLKECLQQAEQQGNMVAVLCVDLDRFKNVNDSLGYDAGDILLLEAAERLLDCVGEQDVVSRFTADEFFLLLPNVASGEAVAKMVDKILLLLDEPYDVMGCQLYLSASVGLTLYPQDAADAETILRNADIATCRAKGKGGRSYCVYLPEMTIRLEELMVLEQAMRQALSRHEFVLHYQPQIALETNQLIGVEALVRWQRPGKGLVGPDQFIPLAEETGLIIALGDWVLRQVCEQACLWRDAGLAQMRLAVNVSPLQFHQKNLAQKISKLLQQYALSADWLEVEITENVIMQDTDSALQTLTALQNIGVSVSLDDFGTGYSSLSYLKHFKVNSLKIDRAFIKDIPNDKDDAAITCAVIAMADKLNIKVVAEGVETQQQLDFLLTEGCDYVQGYYLGRPMAVEQFEQWYQQRTTQISGDS